MRTRSLDTGPPRLESVDTVAGPNRYGTESRRRQPDPACENPRFPPVSQVRSRRPLVRLDLALPPQDWHWLRAIATERSLA